MKFYFNATFLAALLSAWICSNAYAEKTYAPTSFEILYQPTYSMATGGPTSQLGAAGAGLRIGYAMTNNIAFELGGYYNSYVFGGVANLNPTAYAARATGDFAFMPTPSIRLYAGMDANAFFDIPSSLTSTGNKDLGAIIGVRTLTGSGPTRILVGAEYRYAANTIFNYNGGTINNSAVLGTVGLHFGGL